ncbi:MAG: ShlB/FhaC/HecB family hemolysin secretion/activation protein, partial [Microcystaceae cyanobacterium]
PGTNVLDVTVKTAKSFGLQITLDNGRVPSVGTFERNLQLTEANLTGNGDRLSGIYRNTDGSNDIDFSYTLPTNPRNGTLELGYRRIWSEVIEEPFDVLNIDSDYERFKLAFRQPVIQTPNQELALGISLERQSSQTFLMNTPFPLSPGADIEGQTKVSTLRFFQEWTDRSEREVFAARSEFNFGLDIFGATTAFDASGNADAPDTSYFSWRGQAQWVRLLAPDMLLVARTDMQFADRPLVSLEQFAIGGLGSVEGYRQDLLLTDNGVFASVEVRLPIFRAPEQQIVLQVIPFVNFGAGWNNNGTTNPDPNTLASVGLGLQFQQSDRLSARFDWGIPLVDVESTGNTLQEDGFYFTVIYRPF